MSRQTDNLDEHRCATDVPETQGPVCAHNSCRSYHQDAGALDATRSGTRNTTIETSTRKLLRSADLMPTSLVRQGLLGIKSMKCSDATPDWFCPPDLIHDSGDVSLHSLGRFLSERYRCRTPLNMYGPHPLVTGGSARQIRFPLVKVTQDSRMAMISTATNTLVSKQWLAPPR